MIARRLLVAGCLLLGGPVGATSVPDCERVVAQEVRDARARALATLRRRGVHAIDVPAERLTVATIQRYLELKKRLL